MNYIELMEEGSLVRGASGGILSGVAAKDFMYGNVLVLQATEVSFYPSGLIQSMLLKQDTMINGFVFKANTVLEYYDAINHPCSGILAKEAFVDQGACVCQCPAVSRIMFHQNGRVCGLINSVAFACGQPYRSFIGVGQVSFYESGYIFDAVLDQEMVFQQQNEHCVLAESGRIKFYEPIGFFSSIEMARTGSGTYWCKVPLLPGSNAGFYRTDINTELGHLKFATLAIDAVIDGFLLAKHTWIQLHESGKLQHMDLSYPQEVMGLNFLAGEGYVELYPNGNIERFQTSHAMVVQNVEIPAYQTTCFRPDGTLVIPHLAEEQGS